MSNAAYTLKKAKLEVGVASTAKTVTAITKANPARVTATAHGLADGAVVKMSGVVGMVEINGKVGIVRVFDANNFDLLGVDSSSYSTYASGGSATPSLLKAAQVTGYNGFDGQAGETDVTDWDSDAKEYLGGLQDNGAVTFNVQVKDDDDGQNALRASQAASGIVIPFTLTFANGRKRQWNGFVRQFTESGQVDGVVTGQVGIRISGAVVRA